MQIPNANVVTLTQLRIDLLTAVEVQLHSEQMQLLLIVSRIPLLGKTTVREEHGPYGTVGKLRDSLRKLFGEFAAHQVCRPSDSKEAVQA